MRCESATNWPLNPTRHKDGSILQESVWKKLTGLVHSLKDQSKSNNFKVLLAKKVLKCFSETITKFYFWNEFYYLQNDSGLGGINAAAVSFSYSILQINKNKVHFSSYLLHFIVDLKYSENPPSSLLDQSQCTPKWSTMSWFRFAWIFNEIKIWTHLV